MIENTELKNIKKLESNGFTKLTFTRNTSMPTISVTGLDACNYLVVANGPLHYEQIRTHTHVPKFSDECFYFKSTTSRRNNNSKIIQNLTPKNDFFSSLNQNKEDEKLIRIEDIRYLFKKKNNKTSNSSIWTRAPTFPKSTVFLTSVADFDWKNSTKNQKKNFEIFQTKKVLFKTAIKPDWKLKIEGLKLTDKPQPIWSIFSTTNKQLFGNKSFLSLNHRMAKKFFINLDFRNKTLSSSIFNSSSNDFLGLEENVNRCVIKE